MFACRRCGAVWKGRTSNPSKCPSCRSERWNEPRFKLQCRRCGHKWVSRSGSTSEDVKICPSCKSRKWNETPFIHTCLTCGNNFISRRDTANPRCPLCKSSRKPDPGRCPFCGAKWQIGSRYNMCPYCGTDVAGTSESIDLWSEGDMTIRYVFRDGIGLIYLWSNRVPLASLYLRDLLNRFEITSQQFTTWAKDPARKDSWKYLADDMYKHRDDYLGDVSFLSKRFNIDIMDARILAIHFRGMGPEAISLRFDMALNEVRSSFDRIMAAFVDNGIVVDDTVFTDDAMARYS